MVDRISKEQRSRIMASIRGKNTRPEVAVRRLLWSTGSRYRVHDRSITGTPDISSKRKKVAVFLDGCFWHGCSECYREPKSNVGYWRNKVSVNRARRTRVLESLNNDGWLVLEFWEHQILEDPGFVATKISHHIRAAGRKAMPP